ncbi:hypothetical protein CPARA_1gp099 (nucleomorph) [Cryptomonas paramecium]|uniref:Uncharacterized protein n=1 Tax=Cryptomonas paramaecium TaxID=2898 RepID=F2HHG1_9CRYP|nr:hypothetical protein CPARA_1gp099 [Cryptomonas paramecium]AEA38757.1 hypothetical protein CPARA_1gp099 [Cryptomonas paramecium]
MKIRFSFLLFLYKRLGLNFKTENSTSIKKDANEYYKKCIIKIKIDQNISIWVDKHEFSVVLTSNHSQVFEIEQMNTKEVFKKRQCVIGFFYVFKRLKQYTLFDMLEEKVMKTSLKKEIFFIEKMLIYIFDRKNKLNKKIKKNSNLYT